MSNGTACEACPAGQTSSEGEAFCTVCPQGKYALIGGKTCAEWQRRLQLNEDLIRSKWGDEVYVDYDRYLGTCVTGFDKHYQSLAQYALRRID